MLTRPIRATLAGLIAAGAGVTAVVGCASQRRTPSNWPPPGAGEAPPSSKSRPGDPGGEEILAAVEAFLERTVEYHAPKAASDPSSRVDRAAGASRGGAIPEVRPAIRRVEAQPDGGTGDRPGVVANAQVAINDAAVARPALALPVIKSVSWFDPSATPESAPTDPQKVKVTNESLSASPANDAASPDRFVSYLESQAGEGNDFDAEWRLRVTLLALQRDQDALMVSPKLPQEARAILTSFFRVAAAVRRAARDPLAEGSETLDAVEQLRGTVADRADPDVSAVALCRKVVTFGVYEEMSGTDFVAGRTIQTIVYSEIRGFKSEPTDDGRYRTRLATRLEILSAEGRSMWQQEEPEIVDLCRRRRSDFFIAQRVTLPPTLPAGDYVLKVWVEDKLSGRADEATHAFVISSAISITRSG